MSLGVSVGCDFVKARIPESVFSDRLPDTVVFVRETVQTEAVRVADSECVRDDEISPLDMDALADKVSIRVRERDSDWDDDGVADKDFDGVPDSVRDRTLLRVLVDDSKRDEDPTVRVRDSVCEREKLSDGVRTSDEDVDGIATLDSVAVALPDGECDAETDCWVESVTVNDTDAELVCDNDRSLDSLIDRLGFVSLSEKRDADLDTTREIDTVETVRESVSLEMDSDALCINVVDADVTVPEDVTEGRVWEKDLDASGDHDGLSMDKLCESEVVVDAMPDCDAKEADSVSVVLQEPSVSVTETLKSLERVGSRESDGLLETDRERERDDAVMVPERVKDAVRTVTVCVTVRESVDDCEGDQREIVVNDVEGVEMIVRDGEFTNEPVTEGSIDEDNVCVAVVLSTFDALRVRDAVADTSRVKVVETDAEREEEGDTVFVMVVEALSD